MIGAARLPFKRAKGQGRRSFVFAGYHHDIFSRAGRFWLLLAVLGASGMLGAAIGYLPMNLIAVALFPAVVMAAVIIWILPENKNPPIRFMTLTFFAFSVVIIVWPYYLALRLPGVPLIEIRRTLAAFSFLAFIISYSTSKRFRGTMREIVKPGSLGLKALAIFLVFQIVSIPMSVNIPASISYFVKSMFEWTAIFFIGLFVFSKEGNIARFSFILRCIALALVVEGLLEYHQEKILWADHIPSFLNTHDPVAEKIMVPQFRDGAYRVTTSFSTSISFAEFMSMTIPFFLHYLAYGKKLALRFAYLLCDIAICGTILLSQARTGFVGILVAHIAFFAIWAFQRWRQHRSDLIASALTFAMPAMLVMAAIAVVSVPALRVRALGGGTQQASTEGRKEQMRMAIPKVARRPLNGYGAGQGGRALGWTNPAGMPSIDSYVLLLLMNYGVIGFGALVYMFGYAAYSGVRIGTQQVGELTAVLPAAVAIIVWMFSRIVLSQEDTNAVAYMLAAMVFAAMYRAQRKAPPPQDDKAG